jgi:hypothetical protein
MAQQTAVDWLQELYNSRPAYEEFILPEEFEKAKQMDKEQIKAAYNKGYQDGEIDSLDAKDGDVQYFDDAEQYYNETFGK